MIGVPQTNSLPRQMSRAEMARQVVNFIGQPDHPAVLDQAHESINFAIDFLNTRTWENRRTWTDITLVASQSEFRLPANFKAAFKIQVGGADYWMEDVLHYLDPDEFVRVTHSKTAGTVDSPKYCTVINQFAWPYLSLNCPVSQGFVDDTPILRVWYYSRFPHLLSDSDTLSAPQELSQVVVWYAREQMAHKFAESKVSMARSAWLSTIRQIDVEDREMHNYVLFER